MYFFFVLQKNKSPFVNTGNAEKDAGWGLEDAVLSLESCSNGLCGTCGLFMERWLAGELTTTLELRREITELEQIWGASVWGDDSQDGSG